MTSSNNENKSNNNNSITYLNAKDMYNLDQELMSPSHGFSVDQLMELAGISIANAIDIEYQNKFNLLNNKPKVLILCGSGNNGGDGLVTGRHLSHFGLFDVTIYYPKQPPKKELYVNLLKQLNNLNAKILNKLPNENELKEYNLFIDSIMGFSFKPPLKGLWANEIPIINNISNKYNINIVCVDIPSGWDVNKGIIEDSIYINCNMLISLSAPKECCKSFKGIHYLGGRFIPPNLIKKYNLKLPKYNGIEQCIRIDNLNNKL